MLNSACSLTLRGIDFKYNFTAMVPKLNRVTEAIYEEVEAYDVAAGYNEPMIDNGQHHVLELVNDLADVRLMGPIQMGGGVNSKDNLPKHGNFVKYNFLTTPVKLTFTDVNVRIHHERFLRQHTNFKISSYWHPKAMDTKKEVEKVFPSTKDVVYGFRPCGNNVVKVTRKRLTNPPKDIPNGHPWELECYYCCITKRRFPYPPKAKDRLLTNSANAGVTPS